MQVLIIPIGVLFFAQLLKLGIERARGMSRPGELSVQGQLVRYGGVVSSHTAFYTAILLSLGLYEGWDSPVFFLSVCISMLGIRDAVGLRNIIGAQGKVVNQLRDHVAGDVGDDVVERAQERVGHSPAEVVRGAIVGVVCTLVVYWLWQ